MPLHSGSSQSVIGNNIREMQNAGHSHAQSVAAALSNAYRHPHAQGGGGIAGNDVAPFKHFAKGGFIDSSVPGRTDRIPTHVKSDSYVIPADIVSGIGQGNSIAGAHLLDMIFKTGPYSAKPTKTSSLATGGHAGVTPVVVAGGEFVLGPVDVMRIGGGSMTKGHQILDKFVRDMRKHNIETQKSLKPPKK